MSLSENSGQAQRWLARDPESGRSLPLGRGLMTSWLGGPIGQATYYTPAVSALTCAPLVTISQSIYTPAIIKDLRPSDERLEWRQNIIQNIRSQHREAVDCYPAAKLFPHMNFTSAREQEAEPGLMSYGGGRTERYDRGSPQDFAKQEETRYRA